MDVKKVMDEVYLKTGIRIDTNDPLIVLLALNEIVLKGIADKSLHIMAAQNEILIGKVVNESLNGFKLVRADLNNSNAFDIAVSKLEQKLSESTLKACRLVIEQGFTIEAAVSNTSIDRLLLYKRVRAIEKLMGLNNATAAKEAVKTINSSNRVFAFFENKPNIKYVQFFGFFLFGLILMYFLK